MENFSARFDDLAISRDVIGFVRDPFTVSPGGEFSSNVRKMMPLDEAAIQNELIDIQLSGDMNAAHRGAGSLSNFWGDLSQRVWHPEDTGHSVLTMFRINTHLWSCILKNEL